MNEKQGEHLDQRIRHALGNLPDAPPPGSPFNSARLWEQLRPELAAPPVSRKRIGGWWWAAASVAGLLMMGWFWWGQSAPKQTTAITQSVFLSPRSNKVGSVALQTRQVKQIIYPQARQKNNPRTAATANKAEVEIVSIQQEVQPIVPESLRVTSLAKTQTPTVATTTKRRFRVVHENELMAEDEAHRVRYAPEGRTERFVRIGTGNHSQSATNDDLPALQLPLNRKTTQ